MEAVISVVFGVWIVFTAFVYRAFTKPGRKDGWK